MTGQAMWLDIPVGDWLQAVSGFLGVIVTIGATLWIDRGLRRRREIRHIRAAVRNMSAIATNFIEQMPPAMAELNDATFASTAEISFLREIDKFRYVSARADIDDADKWAALKQFVVRLDTHEPMLRTECRLVTGDDVTAPVYAINIEKVGQAYSEIASEARDLVKAL